MKLTEEIEPHGVRHSPDEKTLYATNGQTIMAFDVQPDGERAETAGCSRRAVATAWQSTRRARHRPGGSLPDGRISHIPVGVPPQSVSFAGPNKKTLYIVGRGALCERAD